MAEAARVRDDGRRRLVIETPGGIATQPLPDDDDLAYARVRALMEVMPAGSTWRVERPKKLIPVVAVQRSTPPTADWMDMLTRVSAAR